MLHRRLVVVESLIVRGFSNYCDSRKDDRWRGVDGCFDPANRALTRLGAEFDGQGGLGFVFWGYVLDQD
ncbi:hypothetical protein BJX99DRAFT_237439 [Aspergillus californicus]